MANIFTNAFVTNFQTGLDLVAVQESVTGWMDQNAGQVQYRGGKYVKVPKMTVQGLGNYSKTNGYPAGGVTVEYEQFEMTQDRGTEISLDSMDVDETNFVPEVTKVAAEFQRTQVVPEIDAYRLSKIAARVITAGTNVVYNYTPSKADIVDALIDGITAVRKKNFRNVPFVIHATDAVIGALSKARSDKASEGAFTVNGLTIKVPTIDDIPIIATDADRMVSAITTSATDGWEKGSTAKDVNFLIIPRTAPLAISKLDEPKFFTPKENQKASAWLYQYRRYHDLWIMDNKVPGIYASIKDAQ